MHIMEMMTRQERNPKDLVFLIADKTPDMLHVLLEFALKFAITPTIHPAQSHPTLFHYLKLWDART